MNSVCGSYLFSHNGEFYLYDMNCDIIIQITNDLYVLLSSQYGMDNSMPLKGQEIFAQFRDAGLLQPMKELDESVSDMETAYLTFAPTYKCNFRCSYCFGEYGNKYTGVQREFCDESLFKMLDYFFLKAFPDAHNYRIDFVSGGEPLLGFDIIKKAIEYIETRIGCKGKRISVWLCTNGSLLTDEIIEYLSAHNISIGISIDGSKEYTDMYRKDALGNGTYDRICAGIDLVHKNKNVSKKFKELWGLCSATNENCNFISILNQMQTLGFRNVQIRLIRTHDKYDVKTILNEYERLAQFLLDQFKENRVAYLYMILNDNDQFGKVLRRVILGHLLVRRCSAGINKITICPDGSIYPCDSFVGISQFCMGNIENSDKLPVSSLTDAYVSNISKCSSCPIKYLCGGDCYYNSYMKTGSAFIPDDEFCQIQKRIIELSIVLRFKMEFLDKERYNKIRNEVKRKDDYSEIFG